MEPNSALLDAAIAMHEMYLTLVQAGFTEHQALYVVAVFLKPETK